MAVHFHPLRIKRVSPEAAGAAAITFDVPPALRAQFDFRPGQFLTLRTTLDGRQERRSYSICSPHQRYEQLGEIDVGIKPVAGGSFSRWALQTLRPGVMLEALPPEGRFTPRVTGARHRVGFVAGSGITPLLSIVATTLAQEPQSHFTLVYGNQRIDTIMFNEALQDLKDRYPARLTLIHVLSRQPQETALFNGRIDEEKVGELLRTLLPVQGIAEAFLCGPEGMINAAQRALLAAGLAPERLHAERFYSDGALAAPAAQPTPASARQPVLRRRRGWRSCWMARPTRWRWDPNNACWTPPSLPDSICPIPARAGSAAPAAPACSKGAPKCRRTSRWSSGRSTGASSSPARPAR
jgi:ring-1,2-phenylacetyl-CoA epoxidase subunit PaaE